MVKSKVLTCVLVGVPLILLLLVWILKKKGTPLWIVFSLNVIPAVIPLVLCICSIPGTGLTIANITELNPILWGAYSIAIGFIEWLIDQYKKLLPQTKESYEFNKRYSGIQNQWNLIKNENKDIKQKRMFIDESLRLLEDTITQHTIYYNKLSDRNSDVFASTAGSLFKDYIRLCSSQNEFYNTIFASLYKYLFSEYKSNVLSPIQPNSTDSADLIIPEFVSNGLTQIIINNSQNIKYQHNTSVSTINAFQDNVKKGTELKGFIQSDYLRRIVITDEVSNASLIDVVEFQNILDWHKKSKVELRFISEKEANICKKNYSRVGRLDFSIINMNKEGYFILEANKSDDRLIAGQNHEMYSVKCIHTQTQPDADKLFTQLWDQALIGKITSTKVGFSKP